MSNQRTIIVGDVHGCIDELHWLLKKCQYRRGADLLVFVGDVLHKGPNSVAVLELIKKENARVTLGNHELKFLENFKGKSKPSPSMQIVFDQMGEKTAEYSEWISTWPTFIEEEDFLVVHAGLVPGKHPSKTDKRILANIRTWDGEGVDLNNENDPAWHELYKGKKLVVYGHWARAGLTVKEKTIGLDSGCVYGEKLSAVILPQRQIVQVDAARTYFSYD